MRIVYFALAFALALAMAVGGDVPGQAKSRDGTIRLAAIEPFTPPAEATSGNPSVAPLKWVGLLVIPNPTQQHPNQISMCTAQFIKPNVLLTAGHCVKDLPSSPNGPWPDVTKGNFWLQYQNDVGQAFNIVCAAANPKWSLPANFGSLTKAQQGTAMEAIWQHDFAMILVDGNSPTGVMPYALDWKGKFKAAARVGYPADILDGAIIQRVPGNIFFSTDIPMGNNSVPNIVVHWGPVTDATEGMSGGGWIANFNVNEGPNNNVLIAVSSYHDSNFPGAEFAAYLTAAEFNPLLASVSNGCK